MDLAELDEAVGAAAGEDVDDAVARLLALVGVHQQHEFLLLLERAVIVGRDHAPRIAVADMLMHPVADGGEVVPDIGFDRIVEFVVAALVAIDVAKPDFGEEVVVAPGALAPDLDAGFLADLRRGDDAVGVIGLCRNARKHPREGHGQPEHEALFEAFTAIGLRYPVHGQSPDRYARLRAPQPNAWLRSYGSR